MRWIFAVTVLLKRKYPCFRPTAEHLEGQRVAPEAERERVAGSGRRLQPCPGWAAVFPGCSQMQNALMAETGSEQLRDVVAASLIPISSSGGP